MQCVERNLSRIMKTSFFSEFTIVWLLSLFLVITVAGLHDKAVGAAKCLYTVSTSPGAKTAFQGGTAVLTLCYLRRSTVTTERQTALWEQSEACEQAVPLNSDTSLLKASASDPIEFLNNAILLNNAYSDLLEYVIYFLFILFCYQILTKYGTFTPTVMFYRKGIILFSLYYVSLQILSIVAFLIFIFFKIKIGLSLFIFPTILFFLETFYIKIIVI